MKYKHREGKNPTLATNVAQKQYLHEVVCLNKLCNIVKDELQRCIQFRLISPRAAKKEHFFIFYSNRTLYLLCHFDTG